MSNTSLDTKLGVKIPALLAKLGKDASFKIPATKSYNPRNSTATEGTVTSYTWKVTPPKQLERYINNDIKQGFMWRAFISATDITFTPTIGYDVVIDDKTWQIHEIEIIYSGNLKIGYKLFLRA